MTPHLSTPDLVLVGLYFVGLGWISRHLGGHGKTTRSYLLGDQNVPWWAVALSILGSEISALTFVGVPALAYTSNWAYLQLALGAILARMIVARWFVPAYYEHKVTSIYEFLLTRFGPLTRNIAALLFLVSRVLMSGVRLYAGALIAQVALGLTPGQGICLLAAIGFAYTVVGGIQAVIWTEVIQVIVMFAGALTALAILLSQGGVPHSSQMQIIDLRLDPTLEFTLWTALIGATFSGTAIFGTDYDMVQRMLTAEDSKRSGKAVVWSALADLPIALLFLSIGSALAVFYQGHPDPGLPAQAKEIFPYFIMTRLPVGLAGLVVAAVLSVVLSSFESALNSLAGSFVVDIYRPYWGRGRDDAHCLRVTRWAMGGFTAALVVVALYSQHITEILKFGLEVGTYTYGALLAVFAVGLFTKGGSDRSCAFSVPVAVLVVLAVKTQTHLAFPWFVLIGTLTGASVALAFVGVFGDVGQRTVVVAGADAVPDVVPDLPHGLKGGVHGDAHVQVGDLTDAVGSRDAQDDGGSGSQVGKTDRGGEPV